MVKNKGLGRGLDLLIPTEVDREILLEENDRIDLLSVESILPNPDQPRSVFDEEALSELSTSIKRFGVVQPIIVSPLREKSQYVIVAGERRWRASKIAGLKKIPAIVRRREELEQIEVALIENVQRVDLAPLEQALSVAKLHQQFNLSYQDIAKRLGKALSTIHNIVRLLNLPEDAKEALSSNKITEGHARAILSLKDDINKQADLLKKIINYGWSVRQAERYVVEQKNDSSANQQIEAAKKYVTETKFLSEKLNTKVDIRPTSSGGKIEIFYKSQNELELLIGRFDKI